MQIDEDMVEQFDRDGAVLLCGAISEAWVEVLRAAVERRSALVGEAVDVVDVTATEGGSGQFLMGRGMRFRERDFARFLRDAGIIGIARRFLRETTRMNLSDDQFFAKSRGTSLRTPWHQDGSFWPFRGTFLSIWVALDPITEASGWLQFVRGSHAWGRTFKADGIQYDPSMHDPAHDEIPAIEEHPENYDIVGFKMSPGDAAVFDAFTLHCSQPNVSGAPRRAFNSRWAAADAVYAPRRHASPRHTANAERAGLLPGDPITCDAYPVAWTKEEGQLPGFLAELAEGQPAGL